MILKIKRGIGSAAMVKMDGAVKLHHASKRKNRKREREMKKNLHLDKLLVAWNVSSMAPSLLQSRMGEGDFQRGSNG